MSFRVTGLDPAPFRHLFGLSHAALAAHGVKRYLVDSKPGFPDRVEVRDMEVGETAFPRASRGTESLLHPATVNSCPAATFNHRVLLLNYPLNGYRCESSRRSSSRASRIGR